jgi:hypothetical protein
MSETCVPDELTPCTPRALYDALWQAWAPTVGSLPSRPPLLILLAHWALETGFGHGCHNFNLGNKKHVRGDGRDFTMFRCTEVIGGKVVWFDPPDPTTWFVAFPTLAAGAADYLAGLMRHFGAAWLDVVAGDAAKFCHDLRVAHYYTADEASYTAGVLRCLHQIDAALPADLSPAAVAHAGVLAAGLEVDLTVHDAPPPVRDA